MSNPPAFQMYAADFLVDTADWTVDEIGIYLRLLLYQWVNGRLPDNQKRLSRIAGVSIQKFQKRWGTLDKKFKLNNDGFLYNQRLEKERKKQEEWREKSRLGGINSGKARRRVVEPPIQPKDEPNGNSSVFSLQSSNKHKNKDKSLFLSESDEYRLSDYLFNKILENNPKAKKPNIQVWAKQIDLMIRKDERTIEDIQAVIDWCQDDDFWKVNILSTKKLREKFDQLYVKMIQRGRSGNKANSDRVIEEFLRDTPEGDDEGVGN